MSPRFTKRFIIIPEKLRRLKIVPGGAPVGRGSGAHEGGELCRCAARWESKTQAGRPDGRRWGSAPKGPDPAEAPWCTGTTTATTPGRPRPGSTSPTFVLVKKWGERYIVFICLLWNGSHGKHCFFLGVSPKKIINLKQIGE